MGNKTILIIALIALFFSATAFAMMGGAGGSGHMGDQQHRPSMTTKGDGQQERYGQRDANHGIMGHDAMNHDSTTHGDTDHSNMDHGNMDGSQMSGEAEDFFKEEM